MGTSNNTDISVLEGKYLQTEKIICSMLETYDEMPNFIPVNITKDAVNSVVKFF